MTRGFTGHEHLDQVGLIHMGGRVYDPELGWFLSPDPFVQFPASTQGFNRYAYVGNNPLSYTDPSGYFLKKLMKVAGIGLNFVPGFQGWSTAFLRGFITGFLVSGGDAKAAMLGGIGGAAFGKLGKLDWGAEKIIGHGLVGGALSTAGGGRFGDGFLGAAAAQGFAGTVDRIGLQSDGQVSTDPGQQFARVAAAAAIGGTVSTLGGGKFANGAKTFGFVRLFKEMPAFYRRVVRYDLDISPGTEPVEKGFEGRPVQGANNIGVQRPWKYDADGERRIGFFEEGGRLSNVANRIPGVNAVAGVHDVFQVSMGTSISRDVFNVPGMAVAAAVTYPGFLGQLFNSAPADVYLPAQLGRRNGKGGSTWVPIGGF
nr:RHS repeat-associated core domain-containing protein [Thioalkalivibrio sp. XN8]